MTPKFKVGDYVLYEGKKVEIILTLTHLKQPRYHLVWGEDGHAVEDESELTEIK